ncbi:tyrosine-type recombinase/integrase [Haloarcula amylolytica]|uniref:tyrosine-type recombinase/integrase n=1 Tax=Haloarcula amylolytica TaxID=396317 RepID=UPI003C76D76E
MQPQKAIQLYLENRNDAAQSTIQSYEYRLQHFTRWWSEEKSGVLSSLDELRPHHLEEYRSWRRRDGDLSRASEKTQMDSLRVWLRYCERMDWVIDDLSEAVISPALSKSDKSRDEKVSQEVAEDVLDYLKRFEYASRRHVCILLMWHTAARTGTVRAIDLTDYHPRDEYIDTQHRPSEGTPLKKQEDGERYISISGEVCNVIDDYIRENRIEITDEFDREPLLTTESGRISRSTIRRYAYQSTRQCVYDCGSCPENKEPEECQAAQNHGSESNCPTARSPHSWRRGSITHMLLRDVPSEIVSDRANVSQDVLDEHYDRRSKYDKMETRRGFLDNI